MQRWAVVACGIAWLVGIALAALVPVGGLRVALPAAGLACLAGAVGLGIGLAQGAIAGRGWRVALAALGLLAAALLGMARFAWAGAGNDPQNIAHAGFNTQVQVRGVVTGEPDVRVKGEFIVVAVQEVSPKQNTAWRPADGTVQVYALGLHGKYAPDYGDTVQFSGTVSAPTHVAPGIDADLGAAQVDVVTHSGGNPLLRAIYALREALAGALAQALPAPEAALIIGILLGLKTPVLRARLPLFVRTGTIHLVVTSGLKVTLAAEIAARLARPLGQRASAMLAFGFVAGYVILSGAGPAAIRAGIMGALLILARYLGRDYDVLTALAVACFLMTAVDPAVLWDVGFQLSAAGTLGIALLGARLRVPLASRLGRWRAGRVAADVLASTLAAQIATLPIVAISFGIISFVSLLTNLLLVPFLPLFLVLGALVSVGGLIAPAIGALLGVVAWPILRLADLVIEVTAGWPGAAATVGNVPGWLVPAWVIALGCVPLVWRAPAAAAPAAPRPVLPALLRVGIALALVLVLFAGAVGISAAAAPTAPLAVTFLDVPGGPATLLRLGNGRTVLIDGGADGPSLLAALSAALPFWQRTLDLVIVTDVRTGHYAGLVSLLGAYHIGEVADPGVLHPDVAYATWYTGLQKARIPLVRLARGDSITLASAAPLIRLDVLNPPHPLVVTRDRLDDTNALILRLVTPGLTLLFLGDASDLALAQATQGVDLQADVVQLCQLPNEAILLGTAQADLLRQTNARLVIVAPSARPAPKPGTLNAAPSPDDPAAVAGMTVVRTTQTGVLTLVSDSNGWSLSR
jgi:competence protein ComEC